MTAVMTMEYTGYIFITDRPLEDIPGFRCGSDDRIRGLVCRGCLSFRRSGGAFCERYCTDGCDRTINGILGTEVPGWHVYETMERRYEDLPALLLFVYEYLDHGEHALLYMPSSLPPFHRETPVASIDVAEKGRGHTPMDDGEVLFDVIHHFHRSGPYPVGHGPSILERMASDKPVRPGTYRPSTPLTVQELQRIAGDSIGVLSIHDYDEAAEAISLSMDPDRTDVALNIFRSLELVMNDEAADQYRKITSYSYFGELHDTPIYGSEQVMLYSLGFMDCYLMERLGIGDSDGSLPSGMFILFVLIRPSLRVPDTVPRDPSRIVTGSLGSGFIRLTDGRIRRLTRSIEFDKEFRFLYFRKEIENSIDCAVSLLLHGDPLPDRLEVHPVDDGPEGLMCCTVTPGVVMTYRDEEEGLYLESIIWPEGGGPCLWRR